MSVDTENNDTDDINDQAGEADTKSDTVEHASRSGHAFC